MRIKRNRRTVAATEAAKGFGALIDRVRESRQVYQVESRGQVVAEIAPPRVTFTVDDLRAFSARGPRAPVELIDAIEKARATSREVAPEPTIPLSGHGGRQQRK